MSSLTSPPGTSLTGGRDEARVLLLGGPPFGEPIVMWWNFIGRDHDEIADLPREWQEQITADGAWSGRSVVADGRFGKSTSTSRRSRRRRCPT